MKQSRPLNLNCRLSTNLHCLFPFLLSRHISRLLLRLDSLHLSCECSELKSLLASLQQNLTLLAETGYGEGEICHRLVHPTVGQTEKQNILISASLLVRQKKMLHNILLCHDTLDLLLDTLEEDGEEDGERFTHCVYSLAHLAQHLGVSVCCSEVLSQRSGDQEEICRKKEAGEDEEDLTLLCDDGTRVKVNKQVISSACPVFAAMLSGSFTESERSSIILPHTTGPALTCLVHYLYGCRPVSCPHWADLAGNTLLELVSLSDKYLLTDLNLSVCHDIIRHSVQPQHLTNIYRAAIQNNFPVLCTVREESKPVSLALSVVSFLLVADLRADTRAELVKQIVSSDLAQHLLDDIGKILRAKLANK